MFKSVNRIHFVGIGGIGMSGIAEILLQQGFAISGSDMSESDNVRELRSKGAEIYIGHNSENIHNAEVVVYSSAVNPFTNPETVRASDLGIPIIRRAEMLAEVSRLNYCVAVAGTHGKTTTTSMIALIAINAGIDPTVIVGGRLRDFGGTNARLGKGKWTIVEADEYDRSFLQLQPTIAIINNIEAEHLDIYADIDDIRKTFTEFANKVPFYGLVVLGCDDSGVQKISEDLKRKSVTFGISDDAFYSASNIIESPSGARFDLVCNETVVCNILLKVPGIHNIKNALAAISVAHKMGIEFDVIKQSLEAFNGVYRRFDVRGEFGGVLVIDDYAHHPTEVKATLNAAKSYGRRVVAAFQPHTFTRTQSMYREFAESFDDADVVIITEIYPAREQPIAGVTGKLIADRLVESGKDNVHFIQTLDEVRARIFDILKPGDVFLTIGAGNICDLVDCFDA
jgi:UDP-N-acetylmuramate--alanine ligase